MGAQGWEGKGFMPTQKQEIRESRLEMLRNPESSTCCRLEEMGAHPEGVKAGSHREGDAPAFYCGLSQPRSIVSLVTISGITERLDELMFSNACSRVTGQAKS
jgi:hypothetical protein